MPGLHENPGRLAGISCCDIGMDAVKLAKRRDGWYISGVPPFSVDGIPCDEYGPYETKADAADDMRGVKETLRIMAEEEAAEKSKSKKKASA